MNPRRPSLLIGLLLISATLFLVGCSSQPGHDAGAKDWIQALGARDVLNLSMLRAIVIQTNCNPIWTPVDYVNLSREAYAGNGYILACFNRPARAASLAN